MADSSVTFGVDLEEHGGDDATAALERLRSKIQEDTGALRELQAAMRALKSGPAVDISAFKNLRDQIDATKASLSNNQASFVNMGGTFGKLADGAKGAGDAAKEGGASMEALGQSVKGALGPMGGMIERAQSLIKGLGKAGVAGVIAIAVVALVLLATALVSASVAFAKYAIAQADAARSQRIGLEQMGLTAAEATKLQGSMGALRRATGVSVDDQIKDLKTLKDAQTDTSQAARKAVALARAGGGDEAVKKLVQELKNGKNAAQALAEAQAKFGKIAAEKMLGLENQTANFHADIADLFKDVAVEPFLAALHQLLSLFSQNTAFGRALHTIITAIGNKLVEWATAAIPYVIAGMKQLLIWGLKAYIAINQFLNSSTGKALITILKVVGVVLLALVAASALTMATFALMFALPLIGIGLVVAGISWLLGVIVDFVSAGISAWQGIVDAPGNALGAVLGFVGGFISAGADMIAGFAQGIASGAGAVVDAIVGAAKGAIGAAKAALGISSPSKVFAGLGHFTAKGFAQGIDAGNDNAVAAATDMATSAAGGAAGAVASGGGGGSSSSVSNSRGPVTINITVNGGGGEDIAAKIASAVAGLFEDEGALVGAAA